LHGFEVGRIALQTAEPGAIVGLVAERLMADDSHQQVCDTAVEMREDVVLVERIGQPLERVARAPREQRVRDLFARRELADPDALALAQDSPVGPTPALGALVAA